MMNVSDNKLAGDWRDALAALRTGEPDTVDNAADEAESPADIIQSAPLLITYERKGRGGKQATIISGFECDDERLRDIASTLKQRLATGGSARGGEILVQGDRRADTAAILRSMGFKVKGA